MKKIVFAAISVLFASATVYGATATAMHECQVLKNTTKKAECFDRLAKQAQLDEEEKMKREAFEKTEQEKKKAENALVKAEAERKQAEADKAAAEKAKVIAASRDVLKALRKFENRLEAGVTYNEYPALFSDVSFELKGYTSSEFWKVVPNFSSLCQEAVDSYSDAQSLWRQRISDASKYDNDVTYSNFGLTDYIVAKYPIKAYLSGRAIRPASSAIKVIWNQASQKTNEAESALLLWMKAP